MSEQYGSSVNVTAKKTWVRIALKKIANRYVAIFNPGDKQNVFTENLLDVTGCYNKCLRNYRRIIFLDTEILANFSFKFIP